MQHALVYKFQSLPIELHKRINPHWLLYMAVGFLVFLVTPLLLGSVVYSHAVIRLSTVEPLDLHVSLSGCDVLAVPGSSFEAHFSHWRPLGSGSMEILNNSLRVEAAYSRKILMLGCRLVLHLPKLEPGSSQFHFNSASFSIQPDASAQEAEDYESSIQMTSVSLSQMRLRGSCRLDVSTMARTTFSDVNAALLEARVKGGYFGLHYSSSPDGKVRIDAQDAMVSVRTDGVPVQAQISDEVMKYAALAAPMVHHQASNATFALRTYELSPMPDADGWQATPLLAKVHAAGSTAYIQASHPTATHASCKVPLQVVRGSAAAEASTVLLPSTRELLSKLSNWLQKAKGKQEPRYVVNLHLLAPNAPPGMLKLLSSPVYHAMSLSLASLVTGGMLRPRVHRIVAPVSGMSWLFPQDACKPEDQDDGYLRFGEQQLDAISPEVDIVGLNLTSARWVWDPKGYRAFVFEKMDAQAQAGSSWRPRLLSFKDSWIFLVASSITLCMGLATGVVVLIILGYVVIPNLRQELRKISTFRTASYRMQISIDSESWALHPTMVHWPTRGVLLRWAKRPKATQFRTIVVQARLWPDAASLEGFKGIVRTKHIPVKKLPSPPEFPDMRCFLFVVDVQKDIGPQHSHHLQYDNELEALGRLQAEQEQAPLHAGRPYQFQVIAYDDAASVVEMSAWSRPTMIDSTRKFVELPLLLWQGWCRIFPSSTFKHFVKEHCITLPKDPSMRIKLKQLRLTLVSPGTQSLAGAPPAPPGAKPPRHQVQVFFSTAGSLEATDMVDLPSRDERQDRRLEKSLSEVFNARADANQKCVVLDAFRQSIELNVGKDLGEVLTIEVSVTSEDGEETTAARWKHSWSYLLDVLTHRASAKQELSDEIVLLDGRTPVAFLSAKFDISNPCLPSTARPSTQVPAAESIPDIFRRVRPGSMIYWSETLKLEWDVPPDLQDKEVEIAVVGSKLNISELEHGRLESKKNSSFSATLSTSVKLSAGQHTLTICPAHLLKDGMMCCHLQALEASEGATKRSVLCSHQFALVRPVLLQDVELCYAGFCSRNGIQMEQMDLENLGHFGIRTTERLLRLARGFRAPLPVPHEMQVVTHVEERQMESQESSGLVLIENGPSVVLSSEDPLQLEYRSLTEDNKHFGNSPSAKGGQVIPKEALGMPLLADMGEAGPDGDRTPRTPRTPSRGQRKLRCLDGHRQPVQIPMNLFWRRSADWLPDPLLQYGLLPTAVAQTSGTIGIGLRALLLTLLFWVQFAALMLPVFCLHALVIWHDWVHSDIRSDLAGRDQLHFFMLDFILDPTFFRFANLDFSTQLVIGLSLLYLMLIASTVAYSMVIGVPKPLPFDGFFDKADYFIMCVTSILVAGTMLVVTNALVWVVLGSLIRPADLLPYAIMVGAVATMWHSMLSKFQGMKKYCQSKMTMLLDKALVAIFKVMAGDRQMLSLVDEQKKQFELLQVAVGKAVPKVEQQVAKDMIKMVKSGRNQPGTEELLRNLQREDKTVAKPPQGQSAEMKSADKERKVKKLAKGLALHSATVELMLDSFDNYVVLKRLSEDSAAYTNSSASTLASLMTAARSDCLFGHFLRPMEVGDQQKDTPETEPRVLSLLSHLQNEEMERMDAVVAKCLTKCLDWPRISRQVEFFCSQTLPSRVVLNAVERELSSVVQGSAASQVVLGAYRVGYELFEQRYRTSPVEIFVDCGLLDSESVQKSQVQFILNAEIDAQLKGGSELTPKALIAAVRSLCLHNEKVAATTGSLPKAYFWYNALVAVLKALGWSKEELEPSKGWLPQRWDELTDGSDLFEYSSMEDVVSLVLRISNRGLWKAATKSLLLRTGICGYAACQGSADEAGKLAKELEASNVLDLAFVNQKCKWPADVTKLFEECASVASYGGPMCLPVSQILQFMEALVYVPAAEDGTEVFKEAAPKNHSLVLLSPFADSVEDLAWHKETGGETPGLWHVKPSGRRRLRGLWLELVLQIFSEMDCIPSDLDLFFECQVATLADGAVSYMLRLHKLKAWLKRDYFSKLTDCTFNQFKVIVQHMLKCNIPEKALKEQVFDLCPVIPDDDKAELRAVADLGAALYAYTDHGLWSEALGLVAKRLLSAGPVREYALKHLDDEFDNHDVSKRGVLSVTEAMDLLQSLAVPGLTCSDLGKLLEKELGLEVPRAELHKYFTTMDVNGDGLLQNEEFVQVIRFLMLDYYPHNILKHLNLTLRQIVLFVLGVLIAIGVVFLLVTLVISFFKAGEDLDAALHGGFSAVFGIMGKRLSDEGIGFEDTMKNLEVKLESMMVTALVAVLGLSKEMQDVFRNILNSAEDL